MLNSLTDSKLKALKASKEIFFSVSELCILSLAVLPFITGLLVTKEVFLDKFADGILVWTILFFGITFSNYRQGKLLFFSRMSLGLSSLLFQYISFRYPETATARNFIPSLVLITVYYISLMSVVVKNRILDERIAYLRMETDNVRNENDSIRKSIKLIENNIDSYELRKAFFIFNPSEDISDLQKIAAIKHNLVDLTVDYVAIILIPVKRNEDNEFYVCQRAEAEFFLSGISLTGFELILWGRSSMFDDAYKQAKIYQEKFIELWEKSKGLGGLRNLQFLSLKSENNVIGIDLGPNSLMLKDIRYYIREHYFHKGAQPSPLYFERSALRFGQLDG